MSGDDKEGSNSLDFFSDTKVQPAKLEQGDQKSKGGDKSSGKGLKDLIKGSLDEGKKPFTLDSVLGTAEDVVSGIPGAVTRGVYGVLGFPGAVDELAGRGGNWLLKQAGVAPQFNEKTWLPTYDDFMRWDQQYINEPLGPQHEPKTRLGKILTEPLEWAVGGTGRTAINAPRVLLGAVAGNRRRAMDVLKDAQVADRQGAKLGLVGGGVSQGVQEAGGDKLMGDIGGVGTMLALAPILNRLGVTPAKILRDHGGMADLTPDKINMARNAELASHTVGVPLTAAESFGHDPLSMLAGNLGAMPGSQSIMSKFYEPRFQQVEESTSKLADLLGGGTGTPTKMAQVRQGAPSPSDLAGQVSDASFKGVDAPRAFAAKQARPHFDASRADEVGPEVVQSFLDSLPKAPAGQLPSASEVVSDRIRGRLTKTQEVIDANDPTNKAVLAAAEKDPALKAQIEKGEVQLKTVKLTVPETNLGRIHDALMEFKENTRLPPGAQLSLEDVRMRQIWRDLWGKSGNPSQVTLKDFQTQLRGQSENYDKAWQAYDNAVGPRKAIEGSRSTILADVDKAGRQQKTAPGDLFTKIESELFGQGDRIPTKAEFDSATKALLSHDPSGKLLGQVMQRYLMREFETASKATIGTAENKMTGAKLAANVRGSTASAKRELLDHVLETIEKSRGIPPGTLGGTWRNTLDTFQRTGSTPGMGSMTAPRAELASGARENFRSQLSQLLGAPQSVGKALLNGVMGDVGRSGELAVYKKLAEAMTDPNSPVEALLALSKKNMSPVRRQRLLAPFLEAARIDQQQDEEE